MGLTSHPCLLTNTAASLSALTYIRATLRNDINLKLQEDKLLKNSAPYSKAWAGTTGFDHCLSYIKALENEGLSLDQNLSDYERAQIRSLISLIRDKLMPAVLYFQYLEKDNFEIITKPELNGAVGFVKSFWVTNGVRNHVAKELVDCLNLVGKVAFSSTNVNVTNCPGENGDNTPSASETIIHSTALSLGEEAINLLAERYRKSNGPFFFGQNLSSIDCLLYGYLAVLRGNAWVNNQLQVCLKKNFILSQYIDFIHEKIYPNLELPSKTVDLGYDLAKSLKEQNYNYGVLQRVVQASVYVSVFCVVLSAFNVPVPVFARYLGAKKTEKKK